MNSSQDIIARSTSEMFLNLGTKGPGKLGFGSFSTVWLARDLKFDNRTHATCTCLHTFSKTASVSISP